MFIGAPESDLKYGRSATAFKYYIQLGPIWGRADSSRWSVAGQKLGFRPDVSNVDEGLALGQLLKNNWGVASER